MTDMLRPGWGRRALVLMLSSTLFLLLLGCPEPAGPYSVRVTRDVVYGAGYVSEGPSDPDWELEDLLLDVYRPVDAPGTRPAILLVHGGSFTEGSKEKEEIVEFARYFASYGYVAFAMSYRLAEDYPPAPAYWGAISLSSAVHAAIVDVKAALRFIRANAGTFGVDAGQIGLLGESAGAIAGVAAAVTEPDEYASDGPEFPIPEQNNPGISPAVRAYVHLWGTAFHVLDELDSQDPPTMIVHGDEDDEFFTPVIAARTFNTLLNLFDVPHVYYEAEGFGHGAWDYREDGNSLKRLILEFLNTYLAK